MCCSSEWDRSLAVLPPPFADRRRFYQKTQFDHAILCTFLLERSFMSDNRGRTRREILADAAKVAAAASVAGLAGCFPEVGGNWPTCKEPDADANGDAAATPVTPSVIEVLREESVLGNTYEIQPDVVAAMLDAGLTALAAQVKMFNAGVSAQDGGAQADDAGPSEADGGTDPGDAGQPDAGGDNPWKVLLPTYQAGQRIGVKVNCLGVVATSPALVRAIIASLRDKLGVDPKNQIIVWDRYLVDITGHGKYSADDLADARALGNLTRAVKTGENEADFAADNGFSDPLCQVEKGTKGRVARLSRILTHHTDLTVNCPVLKRHGESGVTGAMKNIYGMIDIPGDYHQPLLNTFLPKLYALPAIRNSISLTILDALVAVTNGATQDARDYAPRRILFAQDPVALDSYAWDLLKQLRASQSFAADDSKPTAWLDKAAALGLGSRNYSLVKA
jgi:uncharacterized protein (DUF362 family)